MTKRHSGKAALLAAVCLLVPVLGSCGLFGVKAPSAIPVPGITANAPAISATPAPTPTPKPVVTIRGLLPGKAPADLPNVLSEVNAKLRQDISTQLDLSWAEAAAYGSAVSAAASSGQSVDFFLSDSTSMAGYAHKQLIVPLDEWIATYGANITRNIDRPVLDAVRMNGKLMGIPNNGGTPLVNADRAFIFRDDLRRKYALPLPDSVENMGKFLTGIEENEPDILSVSSSQIALALMPAFGSETLLAGTEGAVAVSIGADWKALCASVQDAPAFRSAVAKTREWYVAGLIPKGIVGMDDPQGALASGKAAATFAGALSLSALQQAVSEAEPGASLSCLPVLGSGAKVLDGYGGSAICVASGSAHGDSVVRWIDWVYASPDHYDLMSYGVQGKNYTLSDGKLSAQDGSYAGLPGTLFTNVNFMRFEQGVPEDEASTYRNWNLGAQMNPLAGFVFDGTKVSAELASVKTVYNDYAGLLLTGSTDEDALLAEFGAKLKDAGQDRIVAEAQTQANAFLSGGTVGN